MTASFPSLTDRLLANAAWARGLARALVEDAATADDVVQEAWLAALRRPPSGERPLRPWLSRVLRNAARQHRRGERRRKSREQACARDEALPPTADLVARAEAHELLVAAVLALPEPFREAILLRWFEGLSAADIARRAGVPAGTVRWRLAEGRSRLRAELERRDGRMRWVAALLPLAAHAALVPNAPPPVPVLAKAAAVAAIVAAAVVTLALTGLLPWSSPGEPVVASAARDAEPPAPPAPTATTPPAAERGALSPNDSRRELAMPATSGTAQPAAGDAALVSAHIAARLLDEQGQPVAGATVHAWCGPGASEATSDDHGRIDVFVPHRPTDDPRGISAHVEIEAVGFAREQLAVAIGSSEETQLGDIVLQQGGTVRGRVVDTAGQPVGGATVLVPFRQSHETVVGSLRIQAPDSGSGGGSTKTGDDGRFELSGLHTGAVEIAAHTDDSRIGTTRIDVEGGAPVDDVVVTLGTRPDVFAGVVLGPDGEAVPFAPVTGHYDRWFRSGSAATSAGPNGRFHLALEGSTATITARDPQGRLRPAVVEGATKTKLIELRLREPRLLTLRVHGTGGQPVEHFRWLLQDANRDEVYDSGEGTGTARVHVPSASFFVAIDAVGFEEQRCGPFGPDRDDVIECTLSPAPTVAGRITRDGEPVAGAEVALHPLARYRSVEDGFPVWLEPNTPQTTTTDADGRYRLTLREHGSFVVRARAPGTAIAESAVRQERSEDLEHVDLALDEGGTLAGRVVPPAGASAGGVVVGISRGDGAARTTRSAADGTFRFDHLTPGRYHVEARAEELQPGEHNSSTALGAPWRETPWDCEVRAGRTTHYDLVLDENACVLRGYLDVDGEPASSWRATLVPMTSAASTTSQSLDDAGTFVVAVAAPGRYRLVVEPETGAGPRLLAELDLTIGETRWQHALTTGSLRLTRSGASSAPMAIVQEDHAVTIVVPVPAEASALERVPAGRVRVVVMPDDPTALDDPRGWSPLVEVTVPAGGTASVRLP